MSEKGLSKDSEETWKNGIDAVQTEYKPDVVFIDVVQTWYGWESVHYVPSAFLLRSYCVLTASIPRQLRNLHDRFMFLPRQRYVHTTLYKTTLRLFNVRQVLNTSVVRLY